MIYRRSFFAETLITTAVLFLFLSVMLALVAMGRLLSEHTALPAGATLILMLLQLLKSLPQLLSASFFAALVIVYGRMCQTGEFSAWGIAGLSDRHWHTASLAMAAPMAVTIGILAVHTAPWSLRYSAKYVSEVTEAIKLEDAPPSLFGEVQSRQLVYHLDSLSRDKEEALGVFIARTVSPDSLQVMHASRAKTVTGVSGLRSMALEVGQINELNFSTQQGSRISFDSANLSLGSQAPRDNPRLRARSFSSLGSGADGRVEYWWRLAFIPTLLLLCMLALPLARAQLGHGRGYHVVLALLSYWLFYAFNGLFKDLGIREQMPAVAAALAPLSLLLLPLAWSAATWWRKRKQWAL